LNPGRGGIPLCTPSGLCHPILLMTINPQGVKWGVGRDGWRRRCRRNMSVVAPTLPP